MTYMLMHDAKSWTVREMILTPGFQHYVSVHPFPYNRLRNRIRTAVPSVAPLPFPYYVGLPNGYGKTEGPI